MIKYNVSWQTTIDKFIKMTLKNTVLTLQQKAQNNTEKDGPANQDNCRRESKLPTNK